jgi:hypothetical protein
MYGPSPDCKQIFDAEAVCANVCGFFVEVICLLRAMMESAPSLA